MSYLDLQKLQQIQLNLKTISPPEESKPDELSPAKNDDAILNQNTTSTQAEWDKYDITKNEEPKNPINTDISGGGGASADVAVVDENSSNNISPTDELNKKEYEFDEKGNLITYPKNGENFKKTAERLGFKPGTPEYNEFITANAKAGKRNYFVIGDKIKIPPSIQSKINKQGIIGKEEGIAEVNKYKTKLPSTTAATNAEQIEVPVTKQNNLPKNIQDKINSLKNSGDKYTITKDKNGNYNVTVSDGNYMKKNGIGEITMKYDSAGNLETYTQKYNNGKITETTYKGGKKVTTKANSAPQSYQDLAAQVMKKYGGNVRIEYNSKIKKYVLVQTNIPNSNIKEKRLVVDEKSWQEKTSNTDAAIQGAKDAWNNLNLRAIGKSVWEKDTNGIKAAINKSKDAANKNKNSSATAEDYFLTSTTTYTNGKQTQEIYNRGKVKTTKEIRAAKQQNTLKTGAAAANSAETVNGWEKLHVATDISIKMPDNAPPKATEFANAIMDNKEKLMRELNIDSDTYNMLAQTALGIARQETNFGTVSQKMKDISRTPADTIAKLQNKLGLENTSLVRDWSHGVTQLKYTLHTKDDWVKAKLQNLGITNELQLEDTKTCAIATIVVLAKLNQEIETNPKRQAGIKAAQGIEVRFEGYEFDPETNASRQTTDGSTKPWINNITRQDVLCAFWNGGDSNAVLNGTFKPAVSTYSNNVRRYTQEYKLKENQASRTAATEKSEATRPMKDASINNGDIGGIVFMPAMYKDQTAHMNTATEIKQLRDTLTQKGIDPNLKNQLTNALQNGELGFDFGLKQSEIDALTNADIKLILKHLDNLKKTINADKLINTSDGINAQEANTLRTNYATNIGQVEDNFRKEYLNNHSKIYNASESNAKVLRETSTNTGSTNYVNNNGERRGFKHEKARGVNPNTSRGQISQQAKTLADAAHNVVMKNPNNLSSGQCLTGVKDAMKSAGIDISSMAVYGNTPKYVKNWFAAHPEMFTPVEYVAIGNGTARAINASDISSLPAGYIVIWEPEAGGDYKSQAGHIDITNGNGQGYSDATDNLGWGAYNNAKDDSGKGEHGKFSVYKLSDNWQVGSDGKLKLKT